MPASILSTYSTQRYDLKHKLSSVSNNHTTATIDPSICSSTILSMVSSPILQEPLANGHWSERPLSDYSSSNPPSSWWHEEHSGRQSALTDIGFSEGLLSRTTSLTSFHPNAGHYGQSLLTVERRSSKQLLCESLLSAAQVEVHIPAPPSIEGSSEEASGWGEEGQACSVPLLPPETNQASPSTSAIQTHPCTRNIQTPSPSFCLSISQHYHPDYDSDDDYSFSSPSASSSFSISALSEFEMRHTGDLVENMTASTGTFGLHSALEGNITSPSLALSALFAPPSVARLEGSHSGVSLPMNLGDNSQEEIAICEATSQRMGHAAEMRGKGTSPTKAPLSSTDSKAWWRSYPKIQPMDRAAESSGSRRGSGLETRLRLEGPISARRPLEPFNPGPMELNPPLLLPPRLPSPPRMTQQNSLDPSSSLRKMLSVVLPCVPIFPRENEAHENVGRKTRSKSSPRIRFPAILTGHCWKRDTQKPRQEAEAKTVVAEKPRETVLRVQIERQTSYVMDH